jgi:hypothetical protein
MYQEVPDLDCVWIVASGRSRVARQLRIASMNTWEPDTKLAHPR